MPPTTSWARMSLFTNVTRWPTLIVISSGVIPVGEMVIVGGPVATGPDGCGAGIVADGVGDAGEAAGVLPEQALAAVNETTRQRVRNMASPSMPEGALRIRPCLFYP